MNFLCEGFRKLLSDRHTDRRIDRPTDMTEIILRRFREWSKMKKKQEYSESEYIRKGQFVEKLTYLEE